MKNLPHIFLGLFFVYVFFPVQIFPQKDNVWRPVLQAEIDMKTPVVESDADAEAIFWDVLLDDKDRSKLFYNHYVRIKIFTERGREQFSKIDIPFANGKTVEDVAARVIKADGTIIELKPSDIFEREIIRRGKIRVLAKSFAFPGIEVGAIIEYRYKETFKNDSLNGERLIFQRDIPMQRVTYSIRPFKGNTFKFDYRNMSPMEFTLNPEGFYVGTLTNVKSLKEEVKMPPEDEVRAWAQLEYKGFGQGWERLSFYFSRYFSESTKPNKEIEQTAQDLTKNASSPEEKIRNIYNFVRTQIRNVTFDVNLTREQREKIEIKNAADTLRKRLGHETDLNFLFAALAKAAGFQSSLILASDRSENFFNPERNLSESNIHPAGILIRMPDGSGKTVNTGNPYLPFGKLNWYEEDTFSLIVGDTSSQWRKLPVSPYIDSSATRIGNFKLLEDGTLEGKVEIQYDGHQAIGRRMTEYRNSPEKREENFKEEIKSRLSTAEISELSISNFNDAEKPLIYTFKIRVPNYAQRTGKRLIFQPGFFEYGAKPLFTSETRKHPIYFEYPWFEDDTIEFEYPKGFVPDNIVAPGNVSETKNITSLTFEMGIQRDLNKLTYKRRFFFGNGVLLFPASAYSGLKTLWDNFQKADSSVVSLRQQD